MVKELKKLKILHDQHEQKVSSLNEEIVHQNLVCSRVKNSAVTIGQSLADVFLALRNPPPRIRDTYNQVCKYLKYELILLRYKI